MSDNINIRKIDNQGHQTSSFSINSKAPENANCETINGQPSVVQVPEATKVMAQVITPSPSPATPPPTPTPASVNFTGGFGSFAAGANPGINNPPVVTPTATVTLTGSAEDWDNVNARLKRGDNDTNLPLPSRVFGPYPQTLFLGCSVVGMNVSLGWGNQPAQLSVTLAEDTSPHYVCTQDGGRYKDKALGVYSIGNHYYDVIKPQSNANGEMESVTAYFDRVKDFVDINGNVIVPGKIYYAYNVTKKTYEQKYWLGPDPGFLGAKNHFEDGSTKWSYTDPITGKFEASGIPIDILGCPVFFKIDDFVFCGIVKNWRASNTGTGGVQYTVDIEGPNELVNQTQLILDNYAGTIFTKAFDAKSDSLTDDNNGDRKAISGPYNNPRDPAIPLKSYEGNIAIDGNLPNVINVYGFLEAAAPGSFGGANINDLGIKTNLVYHALNFLLSFPNPLADTYLPGETSKNMFNPYGALVGRTPMSASPRDTSQLSNYKIFTFTNSPTVQDKVYTNPNYSSNSFSFSSASQSQAPGAGNNPDITYPKVFPPRQNEGLTGNVINGTLLGPRAVESRIKPGVVGDIFDDKPTTGDGYIDTTGFVNQGSPVNIFSFGLIPPDNLSFKDSTSDLPLEQIQSKQLYYLDLSELPVLSDQLRTEVAGGGIKDLNSFIYDVCSNAGVDFFYELLYVKTSASLPPQKFIKIRTVSRRVQPSDRAVADYISKLREWKVPISSISLGKEFNSQAKPRSMIVGAKQRRLFQTKNWSISYRSSSLLYSLVLDKFIEFSESGEYTHVKNHNYFRIPDPGSIREPPAGKNPRLRSTRINEIKQKFPEFYDLDYNWDDTTIGVTGIFPHRGNYLKTGPNTRSPDYDNAAPVSQIVKSTNNYSYPDSNMSNDYIKDSLKSIFSWAIDDGFKTKQIRDKDPKYNSIENINIDYESDTIDPSPITSLTNLGKIIADQGKALIDSVGSEYMTNQFIRRILNNEKPWALNLQTTLNRFYPIMYNSVCPYFGSIDYIDGSSNYNLSDKTKKPRPVWFDMWTNQLLVIFNAKELPQTKMELIGLYNNGNFIVTESELRAAFAGYETWLNYMQGKIYKPDLFFMIKNALCGDRQIPKPKQKPAPKPKPAEDKRKGPESFGEDSNTTQAPVDQGAVDPKMPNIKLPTSDNDWDACRIFADMFNIRSSWNQATNSADIGGSAVGRPAGLHSAITYDLQQIHRFFSDIASTYYGKKFMVRIPMVLSYKDREVYEDFDPRPTPTPLPNALAPKTLPSGNPPYGRSANTGGGEENVSFKTNKINLSADASKPQYLAEGTGKIYSNYNICPEGAWEEYGNCIDDAIMIGSYQSSIFQDDKGLIQPILGYVADDKFDHDAYFICRNIKACAAQFSDTVPFEYYDLLKRANMYQGHSRYSQFQKG